LTRPRTTTETGLTLRDLTPADLRAVVRIDALHTGKRKPAYIGRLFDGYVGRGARPGRIALGMEAPDGLAGYLFGTVRAFEFGSEECGWVFALGVGPEHLRAGVASALLAAAAERFRARGITKVRTMVRRDDVPLLSLFRASGYVGGAFTQLERNLEG
jgi:ribosomal protein S18 acetylase RimI-like enzyme